MIYYNIPQHVLVQELRRRKYTPYGRPDEISEALQRLDETDGSESTAVRTVPFMSPYRPTEEVVLLRPRDVSGQQGRHVDESMATRAQLEMVRVTRPRAAFGKTVDAKFLAGEVITYWTLNTFFPTLQLHFHSNLSCTIEPNNTLPNIKIGLDNTLRMRLTDLAYEENGRAHPSIIPTFKTKKSKNSVKPGIRILEATMARRTSVAVKQLPIQGASLLTGWTDGRIREKPTATLVQEEHVVVGLRLEGMKEMGFVWACVEDVDGVEFGTRTWGDVRVAGLANVGENAALPFLGVGARGATVVVEKEGKVARR